MSWWDFEEGEKYNLSEVVGRIRSHILYEKDGKAVKNKEEKLRLLEQINKCGQKEIVYSPAKGAWGVSPMNPTCWQTVQGKPIV